MRIAIIAPPWLAVPPPAYGGTELMLDLLAGGLRDRGNRHFGNRDSFAVGMMGT
jgi:hypothetical protein